MQEPVRKKSPSTALRRYPAPEGAGLRGRTTRITQATTTHRDLALRVAVLWASVAALGDGLSTIIAIRSGGTEINPLLGAKPEDETILLLTLAKIVVAYLTQMMPRAFSIPFLWAAITVWGGVTVNNILVSTSAPDPVPLACGLIASILLFSYAMCTVFRSYVRRSPRPDQQRSRLPRWEGVQASSVD
jgi:hypothetical protein